MNELRKILSDLRENTPKAIEHLESIAQPFFFPKGHVILTPEEPLLKIYLITSGMAKGFFLHPMGDILSYIKDMGLIVPLHRMADSPGQDESICFLKDTRGYSLTIAKAKMFLRECPEMMMMLTTLLEDHQMELLDIVMAREKETPEQRFLTYMDCHWGIIKQAPDMDLCEMMLLTKYQLTMLKQRHMPDSYA